MITNEGLARVRASAAVLAAGTVALAALTACSSGSHGSSAAGGSTAAGGGSTAGTGTGSGSGTGAGGSAGSGTQSGPRPSWATALGPGVTVVAPETVAPGNDSPGGVMMGIVDATTTKNFATWCKYIPPGSVQKECEAEAPKVDASKSMQAQLPYAKSAGIGYVAIDGKEALVGTVGTYCSPGQTPECFTNRDPAAIFAGGRSFASLWKTAIAQANGSDSSGTYSLSPIVEINGKWYADVTAP